MKPLNLIALLLFLAGAVWALTRSDRHVRNIQSIYYSAISPFLKAGSGIENKAQSFVKEVRHSRELEAELEVAREQLGRLRLIESRYRSLETENMQLRHALKFKQATKFDVVAARVIRRNHTTWWQTVESSALRPAPPMPAACMCSCYHMISVTRRKRLAPPALPWRRYRLGRAPSRFGERLRATPVRLAAFAPKAG